MISHVLRLSRHQWLGQLVAWLALAVSITGRGLHDCHFADHGGLAHRHSCEADSCASRMSTRDADGTVNCPYAARARRLARLQGIPQWAEIDGSSHTTTHSRGAHVCPICQVLAQAQLAARTVHVHLQRRSDDRPLIEAHQRVVVVICHVPPLRGPPAMV